MLKIFAAFVLTAAPAFAAPSMEEEVTREELEVRQLIDDEGQTGSRLGDDISYDAATDGFASDIEDCRRVTVSYKRSDGRIVTRKVNRCN